MPTADPIPSLLPPSLSPSISATAAFLLCLSVCLGLAWLGYSRCCRGRQLKLWILCVISFYWCNNQIFMMTIPADNDDNKSAFSMPSIYVCIYKYIFVYIYIYIETLCGYITLCAVDRFHFMHFAKRWTQFFIIASLCAFYLCHFPFSVTNTFSICGIIYWFSTIVYSIWWQREFYSFQLFWLYKHSPGTRTKGAPAVHQGVRWIRQMLKYCFDASLCTLSPLGKVTFDFNITFYTRRTLKMVEKRVYLLCTNV